MNLAFARQHFRLSALLIHIDARVAARLAHIATWRTFLLSASCKQE